MNKFNLVPKLNLEPNLKRHLSLWNPLDYLRLLYWVFFFPQALQWYVDKFSDKNVVAKNQTKNDRFKRFRKNFISYRLFIQGCLILFFILLIPIFQIGVFNLNNTNKQTFNVEHNRVSLKGTEQRKNAKYPLNKQDLHFYNQFIKKPQLAEDPSFSKKIATAYSSNSESWEWWLYGLFFGIWIIAHIGILKPWQGISFGLTFTIVLGLQLCMFFLAGYFTRLEQIKNSYLLHTVGISKAVFEIVLDSDILFFLPTGIVLGVVSSIGCSLNRKSQKETAASLIIPLSTMVYALFTDNFVSWIVYLILLNLLSYRLESWLISYLFGRQAVFNTNQLISRVTSLPLPYISSYLKNWLEQDWETGIHNANQLVQYTLQFVPVSKTINKTLATISDAHLIYRVSQLAANPFDWKIVHFASAPLNRTEKALSKNTRIDTSARATAAGFWYLHEQQPDKAAEAFEKVRSLLYGEEVYTLAKTLAIFQPATELDRIANLDVPIFPQDNLLRPETWQVLSSLKRVVEDVRSVQHSVSRTAKALASNRAIGELTAILDAPEIIPEAERELIIKIAQNWKQALERIAKDIGNITVTKPVINPYVIGDPVQGSLFAGREDIMRQLEELWSGDRLQSVVLYGHRRMGKTSILLNISNYLNSEVELAYINLLRLGDSSLGVGEILMQICDGIAEVTGIAPPDDDTLLKLPYRTFERYIKRVGHVNKGLIIAIDEFEKIEELIAAQLIPTDFLGFLRGIVQMNPKIALIFAGLHTLEEMTGDYFQPFFASVIPIHVGFLNAGATRQILSNPIDLTSSTSLTESEFLLDYTSEALDLIHHLTAGQPYLVQLIGFQLVRRYNQQKFEQGMIRYPLFAVKDIEAIIDREFYQRGRYYFAGVWGQAGQDVIGQQEIIKTLAVYPQGLSKSELIARVELDLSICEQAIAILNRHDVIVLTETGCKIVVELFRQWVLRSAQIS